MSNQFISDVIPLPWGSTAIQEFPGPRNVFVVRSYLGLASYNNNFIEDFASTAKYISEFQLYSFQNLRNIL